MTPFLFVYGSLRPGGQGFDLIADDVEIEAPGVLRDHVLVGANYPYPWCISGWGGVVRGEVLALRQVPGLFDVLDEYEGADQPHPEYRRVVRSVTIGTDSVDAWVYVGGPAVPVDAVPVVGGDWMARRLHTHRSH